MCIRDRVKPFEIIELLARVETVLRRFHKEEEQIAIGGLVIDTLSLIHISAKEPAGFKGSL